MATRFGSKITGKALEGRIATIAGIYEFRNIAKLEKVDPPSFTQSKFNGGKMESITRLKANPFPDFVGAWIERGGRAIFLEAKQTSEAVLPAGGAGGLNLTQYENLARWEKCGAACGVIWEFNAAWRFASMRLLREILSSGRKSIKWEWADAIPPGPGLLFDFIASLRKAYPSAIAPKPTPPAPPLPASVPLPVKSEGPGW